MSVKIEEIIQALCCHIHDIKVNYSEEKDMLYYDLNTGAKSGLHLYEDLTYEGRYDYIEGEINAETLRDALAALFLVFEECICDRDFYNNDWKEVGVKLGFVQKVTSTTTKYI